MLGDLLDNRYRIIRTLSKGGFGQTYIAEDTRLPGHPYCVLKHLEPIALDAVQLENARRLFETEAIALGRLGEHPQIPRLLAYFEEKGNFYIVQDLVRGYPLSKELKGKRKWSEVDIYRLLHDVLSILVFVHDRGVIHRDIKPDNLIRRQPDRALVLVDFGSVKQIRAHTPISDETGHTIAIGTMGYMAMEQARGRPRPNSDLYSLGVIGIQAATGIKPRFFKEDFDTGELVWRNKTDVSDDMAAFLTKMVAYHFKDRYSDAWEALRALEQLQVANTAGSAESTGAALNRWPNSLTIDQVASLSNHQSSESESSSLMHPTVSSETIADANKALLPDNKKHQAHVSEPTFIELPETTDTDIAQAATDTILSMQQVLPRSQQNIADTVTIGFDESPSDFNQQVTTQSSSSDSSVTMTADGATSPLSSQDKSDVTESSVNNHGAIRSNDRQHTPRRKESPPPVLSVHPQRSAISSQSTLTFSNTLRMSWGWASQTMDAVKAKIGLQRTNRQTNGWSWRSPSALLGANTIIFGGIGTLVVFGLGFRGYQGMQHQSRIDALLLSIQNLHQKAQYEQCWEQAIHLQSLSQRVYDTAIDWEGQCALSQAQQLAAQQDFMSAIAVAKTIPETAQSHHQDAQILIREWFVESLEQAEFQYAEGRVNAAIATAIDLANSIPSNHPLQSSIQLATLKWNLEQSLWSKAQGLLDDRQWQAAIDQVQPLLHLPPFERRATGLVTEAKANLDIENSQQDQSTPSVVQIAPQSSIRTNRVDLSQNNVLPRRSRKKQP